MSDERIQFNASRRVEVKLKTPRRDGTTHEVMRPLEFMKRLATLVPRPTAHLIRFHGVLAPNAKYGLWWCRKTACLGASGPRSGCR